MLEVSCWEVSEDYLGVALIKPGDSVIIKMKWFNAFYLWVRNKKGGTASRTRPFLSEDDRKRTFFISLKSSLEYQRLNF